MKQTIEYCKKHPVLFFVGIVVTLLPAIILFASWHYTGIKMYRMAPCMPALVGVGVFLSFIVWTINKFWWKNVIADYVAVGWGILSSVAIFIMVGIAISKLAYFLIAGVPFFIAAVLILLLVLLWAGKVRLNKKVRIITAVVLTVVVAAFSIVDLFNLRPVHFKTGAVVFAVEDEYQICWATSTTTTGYVIVDGEKYADDTAGSFNVSTLHKAIVPREKLESAKKYTVVSSGVTLNRSYLTIKTSTVSREYSFRPVDASDGLQIYNVSDNHLLTAAATRAAGYFGKDLDILIANGDHLNEVSRPWQLANMYKMLADITGSSRPVIISRGNHEAVGEMLDELPRYYGSREGTFYYTVRFADTLFIVLDVGNDMKDDNMVISTKANFTAYREQEVAWLDALIADPASSDPTIKHVVAVSHIAFPVDVDRFPDDTLSQMVERLQLLNTEFMIAGHSHNTVFYPVDDPKNVSSFPVIKGSIRCDYRTDGETLAVNEFTGTAIVLSDDDTVIRFTNSRHEVRSEYILD